MTASTPRPKRTRHTLSLDAIVDAAEAIVVDQGVEELTMRKLAAACDVGAMTLYGYVRSKEEILTALVERHLADLPVPAADAREWRELVRGVFSSVHALLRARPELAQIFATQRIQADAAIHRAQLVLTALRDAGMSEAAADAAFDALAAYTVGATLREAMLAADGSAEAQRFAGGLELLIDGIAAQLPEHSA
jgi:TetR/AcrR family tetracycline transcriptional repressor